MTAKKFLAKDFQLAARALRDVKVEDVKNFIESGIPLNVVRFDPGGNTWEKNTALGFMIETSAKIVLLPQYLEQSYIDQTYANRDIIGMMLLDAGADPAQVLEPEWLIRNAEAAGMLQTASR